MHLSDWVAWSDRTSLPEQPGVYIVANTDEHTVYIGRTWGAGGLRDRIRSFNRSATTGVKGHAGGLTYHTTLGSEVDHLLVRFHRPIAVNPDEAILRPYIEYAERRLLWEYVERFGELPACNSE